MQRFEDIKFVYLDSRPQKSISVYIDWFTFESPRTEFHGNCSIIKLIFRIRIAFFPEH